ncbi:MAG: VanW family protein [Clostridiales bacterium]|nr:VanW family protein [Clostridiales bacterium]
MNKNYDDDFIFYDENSEDDSMVDISKSKSDSQPAQDGKHNGSSAYKNKSEKKAAKQAKKSEKNGKKGRKKAIIISVVAVVLVAALGVAGFCLFKDGGIIDEFSEPKEFTFDEGTVVSGVSISDKTLSQAKTLLESKEASFVNPITITVDSNGEVTTLTEKDFEYTYDIDAVLSTVKADQTSEDNGSTGETKTYEITAAVTAESVESVVSEIKESTDKDAVNATVSKFTPYASERFEYSEAEVGYKLDSEDLTEQITSAFESDESQVSITALVEELEADIQVDDIKSNVKKIGSYQTVSTNTSNGTSNMKVALAACNGSIIEPGTTWSFNECTGDSNLESNGYKAAGGIVDGTVTDVIGGGICQASSTIYNAAIRANMTIEDHSNHKYASSYVPTGLDATIDYPRLDLKLSNPTDYQMFIECKVDGTTLYVTIWGYQSSSYDTIKTANEVTKRGSDSYTVKAWRIYYKDGEEVDRESLGSSTYDMSSGYVFIDAANDTKGNKDVDTSDSSSDDDDDDDDSSDSSSSASSKASSTAASSSKASSSKASSSSSSPSSSKASSSGKASSSSSKASSSSSKTSATEKATEATKATSATSQTQQQTHAAEAEETE